MTKSDIENFPFPRIDKMASHQRDQAIELSNQLETSPNKPWNEINDFIFDLYGLDEYDRQVVKDTLEVAQPFSESRNRANAHPTIDERNRFYGELRRFVQPSFAITNETVSIDEIEIPERNIRSSWHFFSVSSSTTSGMTQTEKKNLISQITEEANRTGCSRVIVHEEGRLLVGIIGQYRYWTLSRARLCALDILRNHLDAFPIGRT